MFRLRYGVWISLCVWVLLALRPLSADEGPSASAIDLSAGRGNHAESVNVRPGLLTLKDGDLDHWDHVRPDSHPEIWTPFSGSLNFGLSDTPVWLAFKIRSLQTIESDWVLQIDNPSLASLDIFVLYDDERPPAAEAALVHYKLGRQVPHVQRPYDDTAFAIPLEVFPGESLWVVVRAQSDLGLRVPLRLLTASSYQSERSTYFLAQGIYFGLIAMLVVISFVLWAVLREPVYAAYCAFTLSTALWIATREGLAYAFLWPGLSVWNEAAFFVLLVLGAMCSVEFTRRFLQLERYLPFWNHGLMGLNGLWGMVAFTGLFGPEQLGFGLAAMLILIGGTTLYGVGLMAWRIQVPEARYYLLAWTVLILGACLLMLNYLGFFPASSIADHLMQFGSALEGVLLSLGMGIRLGKYWTERAELLEKEVGERTRALENTMLKLSAANEELNRISKTDPLTGLTNRRDLDVRLEVIWGQARRDQHSLAVVMLDLDHFKRINDDHGHLVGDACLFEVGSLLKRLVPRQGDVVARYGGEEMVLVLSDTTLNAAIALAERIREEVEALVIEFDRGCYHVTLSAGVAAVVPEAGMVASDLISAADRQLYIAKREGRNCVRPLLEVNT